jgi:3-deoxy-7-phosphoheptulonate synthase
VDGNTSIVGMMLESHLYEGSQAITGKQEELKYGISVTDKCIGWEETEKIILAAHEKLKYIPQLGFSLCTSVST